MNIRSCSLQRVSAWRRHAMVRLSQSGWGHHACVYLSNALCWFWVSCSILIYYMQYTYSKYVGRWLKYIYIYTLFILLNIAVKVTGDHISLLLSVFVRTNVFLLKPRIAVVLCAVVHSFFQICYHNFTTVFSGHLQSFPFWRSWF